MRYHEDSDNYSRNSAGFDKMYDILNQYGDEDEDVDVVFKRAPLEVQRKMRAVEGIKSEVDKQRKYGRIVLVITLVFGLLLGALTMLLTYLVPVDELVDTDIFTSIRLYFEPIKEYLIVPLIACTVALLAVLYTSRQSTLSS